MTHSIPCVNDLLYYIDFRRKIASVNDVVATCEAFYTPEAILQAKKVFFDVVGERDGMRFVNRRGKAGENAAKMNIEDLVNAMNKCDNDEISLPTFYSANYANVPHSDDGNVTLNQLLNVINGMKTQLANLEKKMSFEKTVVVSSAAHTDHPSDSNASTRPSTPSLILCSRCVVVVVVVVVFFKLQLSVDHNAKRLDTRAATSSTTAQ